MANPTTREGQTITNAVALAAGGEDFTVVADADGRVWTWGASHSDYDPSEYLLGNGGVCTNCGTEGEQLLPFRISGLSNIVNVTAGGLHALALRSDETVWAWGSNSDGQLGVGVLSPDHYTNSPIQS